MGGASRTLHSKVGFFFWPYDPAYTARMATLGERLGFDLVGVADTPGNAMDLWVALGIAAARTERVTPRGVRHEPDLAPSAGHRVRGGIARCGVRRALHPRRRHRAQRGRQRRRAPVDAERVQGRRRVHARAARR